MGGSSPQPKDKDLKEKKRKRRSFLLTEYLTISYYCTEVKKNVENWNKHHFYRHEAERFTDLL